MPPEPWQIADAQASFTAAITEIGRRVKAGETWLIETPYFRPETTNDSTNQIEVPTPPRHA